MLDSESRVATFSRSSGQATHRTPQAVTLDHEHVAARDRSTSSVVPPLPAHKASLDILLTYAIGMVVALWWRSVWDLMDKYFVVDGALTIVYVSISLSVCLSAFLFALPRRLSWFSCVSMYGYGVQEHPHVFGRAYVLPAIYKSSKLYGI